MKSVIVQIPATTSNLGPGFDSLGVALSLYSFVKVTLTDDGWIYCENSDTLLDRYSEAIVTEAGISFDQETSIRVGGFSFDIWGDLPVARGLGSSGALRLGILAGLNYLHDSPLDEDDLIRLGTRLDGAPDGIAAAVRGGFCVSRIHPVTKVYQSSIRFELPDDITFVTLVPKTRVQTDEQRSALPDKISFRDAARTVNSLSMVMAAIISGQFEKLRGAMTDYLHQPYRERLCPFTAEAIKAGESSGAYAGWLSGSGSSIICLASKKLATEVGKAMLSVFESHDHEAQLLKLKPVKEGLKVDPVLEED